LTPQSPAPATLTVQALLNCLVREVCGPPGHAREDAGHLIVRLPKSGALLRARLRRPSAGLGPRLSGDAEERRRGRWEPLGWRRLADLVAAELTLTTGIANPEFAAQVRDSHAAMAAIIRAQAGTPRPAGSRISRYIASEQSLTAGHRFHPAPKARQGSPGDWLRYAPEAGARFPLRFLAVRDDVAVGVGDTAALDTLGGPAPPAGYRVLPAHPWQFRLQAADADGWLRRGLDAGLVLDLGEGDRAVVPTSSVRTVYDPAADVFCKFSLGVRITNCVRTSAWYELAGSVELSGLLGPVLAGLAGRYPGVAMLAEPGYRTVAASSRGAYEGLAVIVRDGLRPHLLPGVTPLLAAALTEPAPPAAMQDPAAWWGAYVRLLVPPVLDLLVTHGVALEPHLQNVLVGVDAAGLPAQVIFRDLEGTKLVRGQHSALLAALSAALPPGAVGRLAYGQDLAWNRVLYCLLVNHLAEIAAALADRAPDRPEVLEAWLWSDLRDVLAKCAADLGWPSRLRALLGGAALPGKANLRVRWARAADREAGYVPVPSPFGRGLPETAQ
jgi:siderophore synthetase component